MICPFSIMGDETSSGGFSHGCSNLSPQAREGLLDVSLWEGTLDEL